MTAHPFRLTRDQAANLTSTRTHGDTTYFRVFMPYLLQRVAYLGIKHVHLPLNRDYKPMGIRNGIVDYAEHIEISAVRFPRAASACPEIWPHTAGDSFWLYGDSYETRIDYFDRLAMLLFKSLPLLDPTSPRIRCMKAEAARQDRTTVSQNTRG